MMVRIKPWTLTLIVFVWMAALGVGLALAYLSSVEATVAPLSALP